METENKLEADDRHAPRNLSFGENLALTIKVLMGVMLVGGALWGLNVLVSAR